ncbi:MAG: zinc carboxypeptidase, partial [candidate division Zixibacteria bacterium]|nr:zinc carboxypeptidase [candidate division Zixibacteria bacterium]
MSFLRICLGGVFLLLLLTQLVYAKPVYQQAKIYFETAEEFNQLKTKYLDIVGQQDDYLEVVIFPEELEELSQAGFGTEVVIDDMTAFFQSRLDPTRDMGGYKTLDEINAYVDQMILDHPDLVSAKFNMGLSLEGRPMWAVKISDNPNVDEDEPEVLYTAAIHCREMITPEVLFYFMNYLTNNYGTDPEATFLVDNREMWFIPVFNV